jgi:hypothetical protein
MAARRPHALAHRDPTPRSFALLARPRSPVHVVRARARLGLCDGDQLSAASLLQPVRLSHCVPPPASARPRLCLRARGCPYARGVAAASLRAAMAAAGVAALPLHFLPLPPWPRRSLPGLALRRGRLPHARPPFAVWLLASSGLAHACPRPLCVPWLPSSSFPLARRLWCVGGARSCFAMGSPLGRPLTRPPAAAAARSNSSSRARCYRPAAPPRPPPAPSACVPTPARFACARNRARCP